MLEETEPQKDAFIKFLNRLEQGGKAELKNDDENDPVRIKKEQNETHNCELTFKITEKCKDCDKFYEIEIKQDIDNLENVFTTIKNLRDVLSLRYGNFLNREY